MGMNAEQVSEQQVHDVTLQEACVSCNGPIAARFTRLGASGVCLACHMITLLGVARAKDGVHVGHLPRGLA